MKIGYKAFRKRLKAASVLKRFDEKFPRKYVVRYAPSQWSLLAHLCDLYGSDKGELRSSGHPYPWPSHSYSDYYSTLFEHCRHGVTKVFECGLGTNNPDRDSTMGEGGKPGASLRVWRDYFPNATIVGCDIDRTILFQEQRISTYFIDQTDSGAVTAFWSGVAIRDFDLMIDDGLHTFEAGITLFQGSIDRLGPDGVYVIEDVPLKDLGSFQAYFSTRPYDVHFVSLSSPGRWLGRSNLIAIRKSKSFSDRPT